MINKQKAVALLESVQSGELAPLSYINPSKYIQHNFMLVDGLEGFKEVLKNNQDFKIKVIRAFEDGNYVFTHSEYDIFSPKIGFDIFRFEEGLIVEHWDNLMDRKPKNKSGNSQIDGEISIKDLDKTEKNKDTVKHFIKDILQNQQQNFTDYIYQKNVIQHNSDDNFLKMTYQKTHIILGEGNFVLAVSEGKSEEQITTFYDLFRLENGKIVEHWDVIEPLIAKENWKNTNGKFGF